jgi:aryl-alcohol dehydrogenase-like predicted oxidoreductase
MIFGSLVDEPAARAVLDQADELGFDFLDCADAYPVPAAPETAGRTEEILGRWLHGRRDRFVVATKFAGRVGTGRDDLGGSRRHVTIACESSLRRLGTDRIDLYYAHHSDLGPDLDEALDAMHRLVDQGKVLYWGLSNFEAWQLGQALVFGSRAGRGQLLALQPRYNLLHRTAERDLIPLCQAFGIAVIPYNPLGAGMLSGRYRRGQEPPAESRFGQGEYGRMYQGRYWSEVAFDVVEELERLAREEGTSPARLALAWLLSRPGVSVPIIGASKPEQLRDSAGALDLKPSPETLTRLDEVSAQFT